MDSIENIAKDMLDDLRYLMCNGKFSARAWQKYGNRLSEVEAIDKYEYTRKIQQSHEESKEQQ